MRVSKLSRWVLLGTVATLGTIGEANAQVAPSASGAEEQVEDIVVTGSRVARSGFASPTPLTIIDSVKLQSSGQVSIGESLVRLPAFRDTDSPEQAGRFAGGGQGLLDLRGLGAVRTLLLVDGRRFVATNPDGTIDSNLIPASLVERVDVVTGGASSAYGSDAVAGVVNMVLKEKLDGVVGKAQYGISQRGDAIEKSFSLAAGTSLLDDRLHVIVGGDLSLSKGTGTIYSRDWSADEEWLIPYPTNRAAGQPARAFASNVTYGAMTPGSLVLSGPLAGTAFGPGGTPYPFQRGQLVGNVMIGGSNPGINPAGNYLMVQPVDRYAVLGRVTFDINNDTHIFAEASYGHHKTSGWVTWFQSPSLIINGDNPYIPAATRAEMQRLGLNSLTVGRINTDLGGGRFHVENYDTQRYVAGASGKILDAVDWDVYFTHGQATLREEVPIDVLPANLLAAVYAVPGPNGQPVCGPLATNPNLTAAQRAIVTPNCVPFNVFGENSRSADALNYVLEEAGFRNVIKQDVVALNLRAKPFSTWAGPVAVAIGAEARRESVKVTSDALSLVRAHTLFNQAPYTGSASVKEAYAELLVPLAADAGWAKSLNLDLAGRVTDYSTSGTVVTWKAGLAYETPFGLRLRATRSRDIRAPSLEELFGAGTFGSFLNGARNPFTGATGSLNGQTGGNPNLKPEIANTLTFGFTYQPSWAPGLGMSIDAYDIKIAGVITTPTAADVISRCASNDQRYCDLIVTDNTAFGISHVLLKPANLSERWANGLDFELSYQLPGDSIASWLPGQFSVRALATWIRHFQTTDAGVTIERAGSGIGGSPTWTYNVDFGYTSERFSANLNLRGLNGIKWDSTALGPEDQGYDPTSPVSVNKNRFPAAAYLNLSASYDLIRSGDRRLQLFGSINNLLDKDPPAYALVAFNNGGNPYGVVGRYFRTGVRFQY